jgi:lactoylglutathione lyase
MMMIESVATISLFVNDQDKALNFYANKLGFEVRRDISMGASRWIEVAPKGARTSLVLYVPDENWAHYRQVVGKAQPITLDVHNIHALVEDLKSKGVRFASEPAQEPWGTYVVMLDDEDNAMILVEQPKFQS